MTGVGWPKAPRAVPTIMAIAIPKTRTFKRCGIRNAMKMSRNCPTKAGKTSQSSHPTFALWFRRMMKRATTSAVHTVGRMVAAVYRNGGVTRREAMMGCDHNNNIRQGEKFGIEERRRWHEDRNFLG